LSSLIRKLYNFLNRKWFFDKVYNEYLGQLFFKFSYSISYKLVDRGIFEILGPTGLSSSALSIGSSLHRLQTGSIYHLTLTVLVGITILFSLRQLFFIISTVDIYWLDYKLVVLVLISILFLANYYDSSYTE